jgi:hypothetical protein
VSKVGSGVRAGVLVLFVSLLGCPPSSSGMGVSQTLPVVCAHEGDRCEFAPGKIGLCTQKAYGCDGGSSCFVCMSLH